MDGRGAREVRRIKFKLADRHHRLFTDKIEHSGKDGAPLTAVINLFAFPQVVPQ